MIEEFVISTTAEPVYTDEELDYYYQERCTSPNFTDIYKCLPLDKNEKLWVVIMDLILQSIIACFGIVGNSLAIAVLHKDTRSSSTNIILKALAVCDILSLTLSTLYNGLRSYIYYFTEASYYDTVIAERVAKSITYFILPMSTAAIYGSVVLTVVVTADRFVAVCMPMVVRRKQQIYTTVSVLSVGVIVYHIPVFFEYEVFTYAGLYRKNFHEGFDLPTYRILTADSLHQNIYYQVIYKILLAAILKDLGPIILLIYFNTRLYIALKRMRRRYLNMRRGSNRTETRRHSSSSESLTRTVVVVTFTFTLLTLPTLLLKLCITSSQIANLTDRGDIVAMLQPLIYNIHFRSVCNLLVSTASSVNFIIYIIFANKFKKIFITMFCNFGMMKRKFEDILMSNSSDGLPRGNGAVATTSTAAMVQQVNPEINNSQKILLDEEENKEDGEQLTSILKTSAGDAVGADGESCSGSTRKKDITFSLA